MTRLTLCVKGTQSVQASIPTQSVGTRYYTKLACLTYASGLIEMDWLALSLPMLMP